MPLYDADNRLADDPCAVLTRARDNESILEYNLYDQFGNCGTNCTDRKEKLRDFASDYPNLRFMDGHGFAPCDVDNDSRLRQASRWTHSRNRQQLANRVFTAVPDLARGVLYPNIESTLLSAQDTTLLRQCHRLGEQTWSRFTPNVDVQCADHIIPSWTWGGDSSRDIARSKEFLASIGYKVTADNFTCATSTS